jgi:phosphatidate cytidylyltransferase
LNGAADSAPAKPAGKPRRLGRFELNLDWITRPLFGAMLAALAIGAAWDGRWLFALFLAAGSIAGVREWHRMFLREGYSKYFAVSAAVITGSLVVQNLVSSGSPGEQILPWLILAGGALIDLGLSLGAPRTALWHGAGALYVGATPLSLLALRSAPAGGFWLVIAIFVAVWTTDTGALIAGNLIGGAKLAPKLSPNKTWAGAVGGAACAALATAIVYALIGADVWRGALLGVGMSAIGQAGDLFESWVKRRVGRKNSGSLIPGHGGVLDRIDSILFVAPVAAFAVLVLGFHPLVGP